jgi:hypothetical protein
MGPLMGNVDSSKVLKKTWLNLQLSGPILYYCTSYAWSDSVPLADHAVNRHHINRRDTLIKLLEDPIPESYKSGLKVMEAVLGHPSLTCLYWQVYSLNDCYFKLAAPLSVPERLGAGAGGLLRDSTAAGQLHPACRHHDQLSAHQQHQYHVLSSQQHSARCELACDRLGLQLGHQ